MNQKPFAVGVRWTLEGVEFLIRHPITGLPVKLFVCEPEIARDLAFSLTTNSFIVEDERKKRQG